MNFDTFATARRTRRSKAGRLAAVVATVLLPLPALATTLVTPLLKSHDGTYITCMATNGGPTTAHVTVTAYDVSGTPNTGVNFCQADLAPGASCYAYVGNDHDASCSFDAHGKIRAAALVNDASTLRPILAIPATK